MPVNAFRTSQLQFVEDKMESFSSYSEFQEAKKRQCSYSKFLLRVAKELGVVTLFDDMTTAPVKFSTDYSSTNPVKKGAYNVRAKAEAPDSDVYRRRFDKALSHISVKISSSKDNQRIRGTCVLCCQKCGLVKKNHGRFGRKHNRKCIACGVWLCDKAYSKSDNRSCFEIYHSDKKLPSLLCLAPPIPSPSRIERSVLRREIHKKRTSQPSTLKKSVRRRTISPVIGLEKEQEEKDEDEIILPSPRVTRSRATK